MPRRPLCGSGVRILLQGAPAAVFRMPGALLCLSAGGRRAIARSGPVPLPREG